MTTEQRIFIEQLAGYVTEYAPKYGINVCSPIIAQGILESGWGKSKLSSQYHNYFGLKCGSKWTGKSVNMTTDEEYTAGVKTTIKDNFRVYDSMEDGVKGYFEFIQLERYQNLKGITDPKKYLETIKADGYATASDYVEDVMGVVTAYNLTSYDPGAKPATTSTVTVKESDIIIYGHGSGTPRKADLKTYTTERYAKTAPNGVHKGIAAVRRFKALTDPGRVKFEEKYRTILGRNKYSQNLRGYVYSKYKDGKYYSDCSSSGMATLDAIGYYVGSYLLNTAGIYTSGLFEDVPVTIKNGHIMNPEVLKVGDAVLYIGNDPSRPLQIGHVEWVARVPSVTVQGGQGTTGKAKAGYSGSFPELPSRGFYTVGDGYKQLTGMQKEIKKLQTLVNWITGGKIKIDGKYGNLTAEAVEKAQTILKVNPDGLFGSKTLLAAKAHKR